MGDWIYRTSVDQDWISLIFFINLILVVGLNYSETNIFRDILKVHLSSIYISKYTSDRNLTFRDSFNILSAALTITSLSLLITWFMTEVFDSVLFAFEFYYILLGITFLGLIRFITVRFVLKQMNMLNKINIYQFRGFTHNTQFSIFLFILLFIGHYAALSPGIIIGFLILLILLWAILQARILLSFIKSNPKDIFYLIFYLCTIKMAPWLWLYFMIIESRL